MTYDFKFPDVGEGIAEATIIRFLVKEGDLIKEDQPFVEIETDKAVVEIPSPTSGKIKKIIFKDQDTVRVGDIIAQIQTDEIENNNSKESENSNKSNPDQETKSTLQENLSKQKKNPSSQDILALPKVRKFARDNNINLSNISGSGKNGEILLSDLNKDTSNIPNPSNKIIASPSTKNYALDNNIDISKVSPKQGSIKITKEDIDNYMKANEDISVSKTKSFNSIASNQSAIRKTIAKNLMNSLNNTALCTVFDEVNVTKLKNIKDNTNLSYLAFITKATQYTLNEYLVFNSTIIDNHLVNHENIDISIAVDTPKGLMVPVLRDVQDMSLNNIMKNIHVLAQKARDNKLSPEDTLGGTFTISSLGSIGGQGFTPIINYPQIAILGIGRVEKKPVVLDTQIKIGYLVTLSLSFDHQYIDGADAARFLNHLKDLLENPDKILLRLK